MASAERLEAGLKAEEESALRSLQMDLFQTKADLAFERECIDRACNSLRGAIDIFATPGDSDNKLHRLASVIDDAEKHLRRRRTA